jgi:glutamate/tyrosine decarboxylase-like PLP-dependent enzyme
MAHTGVNACPFFPSMDERRRYDDHLSALLAESQQSVMRGPVSPTFDLGSFREELRAFDFERTVPIEDLLGWTISRLEVGLVHVNHPRYFGLFNPAPTFPAQCADRISAMFNPQLATATTSPAAVEIETHVIRAVAQRAGLDHEVAGHFTSGGSEANYTALICALTQAEPGFATVGSRAFPGQPVLYISQDSHLAWIKIAHQAGIGRAAVRLVETDGAGRISTNALTSAISADRADGRIPIMVVATAGTTNAGMIDPLHRCAEIAAGNGLWYHVDAAWGGAVIASDRLRGLVTGIEHADSITIDAHKWWAVTMGCGMFLTRHLAALSTAFGVPASYMPSYAPAIDPYVTTAQWSRRFLGLRLFLSLGSGGWTSYAAHVERAVALIRLFVQHAEERRWSVANEPALAVACIEPPPGSLAVRDIVRRTVASGGAWISAAVFEGRDVIRVCVTNGETTQSDVLAAVELLESARC